MEANGDCTNAGIYFQKSSAGDATLGKPRQSYGEVVLREKVSVPLPRKIKEEILAQGGHVCILTARSSHDSHTPLDGANPRRTAVFLDDAAPPLPQGRQHPHVRLRHRPGPEPEGPAGADGVWVDRVPHHGAGFGELGPQFAFSADAVRPHALYQEYTHPGIHLTGQYLIILLSLHRIQFSLDLTRSLTVSCVLPHLH